MSDKIIILSVGPVPINGSNNVEGGGLRAWGLAKGLAQNGIETTIAIPENFYQPNQPSIKDGIKICSWSFEKLERLIQPYNSIYILYSRGDLTKKIVEILPKEKQLIVDLYVPIYIESLARDLKKTPSEYVQHQQNIQNWNLAFSRGDYFICANQSQYHFYHGILSSMGRINPITFDQNNLEIVPYGIHSEQIKHTKDVCKGILVDKNDFVILWFGGLYPWFDIEPLLHSMELLNQKYPNIKLVILGGKNPFVTEKNFMKQYDFALNFSKEKKLFEKSIFFVDWIPYEERNNWYIESDLVINLHHKTKETVYSWRTRIIDFLWGEIPIISTGGDEATEYFSKNGGAILLEKNSKKEIVTKIEELYKNKNLLLTMKKKMAEIKKDFYWDNVTKNLADFIKKGKIAPDRKFMHEHDLKNDIPSQINPVFNHGLIRRLIKKSMYSIKNDGFFSFLKKSLQYIKKISSF